MNFYDFLSNQCDDLNTVPTTLNRGPRSAPITVNFCQLAEDVGVDQTDIDQQAALRQQASLELEAVINQQAAIYQQVTSEQQGFQQEHLSYTPPQVESQLYTPPQEESQLYTPPQEESQLYTPPQEESQLYTPPQEESQLYTPPQEESQLYTPPQEESQTYTSPQDEMLHTVLYQEQQPSVALPPHQVPLAYWQHQPGYTIPIQVRVLPIDESENSVKQVTIQQKKFSCQFCGKRFDRMCHRTQHINAMHDETRIFRCNLCGKRFNNQEKLDNHVMKHTSVKPHQCNLCSKSYTVKCDLNKHIISVHNHQFPSRCDFCHKGFVRKDHLAKHLEGCKLRPHSPPFSDFEAALCPGVLSAHNSREETSKGIKEKVSYKKGNWIIMGCLLAKRSICG
ncbi:zinc finger protein Gfi-1b-like [Aethina tumida]|uniref:zinc finger protein Gfi-1b-like n=1 Tax=Aethina tumida TaxID=116153 RepID=UPI002148CBF2|nr:zinc finger protein Gfi-1b-like [Aethina tumida]